MMFPGMQCWPPYSLIPSILGLESLVFCVEPPCFLEALQTTHTINKALIVVEIAPQQCYTPSRLTVLIAY